MNIPMYPPAMILTMTNGTILLRAYTVTAQDAQVLINGLYEAIAELETIQQDMPQKKETK
jgi:hypothetical protein